MPFFGLIGIALGVLKITGYVAMSWGLIAVIALAPMIAAVAVVVVCMVVGVVATVAHSHRASRPLPRWRR